MKNYYQILGLESNATAEEIKAAYKYLAKKFHPDMNPGDAKSKKYFQDIQEAYECLSNENRRNTYDAAFKTWSEGNNANQQQAVDNSKEIEKFQALFKKIQKNYLIVGLILSTLAAVGLAVAPKDTLGGLGVQVPFIAAAALYLALYLYFLPSIIAYKNAHPYKNEIFILNCFSIFANLLTPLTFIVFFVCLLIYANNKTKGINMLFMAIIGLFLSGMSAKHEREKQ